MALVEGVLALALLISRQFALSCLSVWSPQFESLIKAEPTLVDQRGRAMRAQRLTRANMLEALRADATSEEDRAAMVVLETDGSLSVVPNDKCGSAVDPVLDRSSAPGTLS